jgi:hypothetical protein
MWLKTMTKNPIFTCRLPFWRHCFLLQLTCGNPLYPVKNLEPYVIYAGFAVFMAACLVRWWGLKSIGLISIPGRIYKNHRLITTGPTAGSGIPYTLELCSILWLYRWYSTPGEL